MADTQATRRQISGAAPARRGTLLTGQEQAEALEAVAARRDLSTTTGQTRQRPRPPNAPVAGKAVPRYPGPEPPDGETRQSSADAALLASTRQRRRAGLALTPPPMPGSASVLLMRAASSGSDMPPQTYSANALATGTPRGDVLAT